MERKSLEKKERSFDFSGYTVHDLAFYRVYGSLDDPVIAQIGNISKIKNAIEDYVKTKSSEYQHEFREDVKVMVRQKMNQELEDEDTGLEGVFSDDENLFH